MRIFISGGCKNGKSYYAQRLAKAQGAPLYYIATMTPADDEDGERIARHRRDRAGWGFTTVEQPADIENILRVCDTGGSFLLDSVTALLANEMFGGGGGCDDGGGCGGGCGACCGGGRAKEAALKTKEGLLRTIGQISDIVTVSDYIYSDALFYDPLSESYRKALAEIDCAAAAASDVVVEIAYTNVIVHKGGELFGTLYEKVF